MISRLLLLCLFFVDLNAEEPLSCPLLANCNGKGECGLEGAGCFCDLGFEGETCAVPPAELRPGEAVPGFVTPKAYKAYRVSFENFRVGDEVVVKQLEGEVEAFIQVGTAPVEGAGGSIIDHQGRDEFSQRADNTRVVRVTTLESVPAGNKDLHLYVTVAGLVPGKSGGAYFEVYIRQQGSEDYVIDGIDDWAAYALFGELGLLVLALCGLAIFVYLMLFRRGPSALARQQELMKKYEKQLGKAVGKAGTPDNGSQHASNAYGYEYDATAATAAAAGTEMYDVSGFYQGASIDASLYGQGDTVGGGYAHAAGAAYLPGGGGSSNGHYPMQHSGSSIYEQQAGAIYY